MAKQKGASRRDFLGVAGTTAASVVLPTLGGSAVVRADAADRPNVLMVLSDDHSYPHVGCYGDRDIKTPNLDRFAAQGMRFDRAYVSCPQCVPSRASIMTGRSPVAIQMTRFSAPLPAEVKIYPELLRARGYFAGVAGRTYHLDGSSRRPEESSRVFEKYDLATFPRRLDFVKQTAGGPRILEQFAEFLDQVPKERPWVLQLCFNDPHRPLDRNALPEAHDPGKLTLPAHFPDTKLVREDFARYYDEIGRLDGDFGRVMAILEERKLSQNTLVVFMGDNGSSQLRGKGTLYEFGIHVPLVIRWPGKVRAGSSSAELISGEDFAPTLLEAAGAAVPREVTGHSFLNLLLGQRFEGRRHVFAERGAHGSSLPTNSAAFDLARCVVTPTHKLIYTVLWQIPYTPVDCSNDEFWKELKSMNAEGKLSAEMSRLYFSPTRPMFELFDLKQDPSEFDNLIGKKEVSAIESDLKARLQEWMILERDYVPLPVPPPPQAAARARS